MSYATRQLRAVRAVVSLFLVLLILSTAIPIAAQTPETDFCAGLPKSQLSADKSARVIGRNNTRDPGPPGAYLKPEPSRIGPVLRYLSPGAVVQISAEGAPTCTLDGARWWPVIFGDFKGWMTESVGPDYILAPFEGEAPPPLPTTLSPLLFCIRPRLPLPGTTPEPSPTPSGPSVLRIVFGGADGTLQYSDNLGPTRIVTQFDPPPLSVDLSPDGSAALVVNYNGIYWVDMLTTKTVLLADSTTFNLPEDMWPRRVLWAPDGQNAAIEFEDTRSNEYSFPLWNFSVIGLGAPFPVDTGTLPRRAVRRPPQRDALIVVSARDIFVYPPNQAEEPRVLLEYVPRVGEGDARDLVVPAISWAADGKGFYTYIPQAEETPPDDPTATRLWYVPLEGDAEDLGKPLNVQPEDYVIPSPDGKLLLLGRGSTWRIQQPDTGNVLRDVPPVQFLFDWTPDSKGVVYTTLEGKIGYIGVDGSTESSFVPAAADNLFGITWMPNGTTFYMVRGADGKLTLSAQKPGEQPRFVGIISNEDAFSVGEFPTAPGLGAAPEPCQ